MPVRPTQGRGGNLNVPFTRVPWISGSETASSDLLSLCIVACTTQALCILDREIGYGEKTKADKERQTEMKTSRVGKESQTRHGCTEIYLPSYLQRRT